MLKILMLGWEYPPYSRGGLGTHCYNLLNEFKKIKNVKVYFITPHPIHEKSRNVEIVGLDISQKYKENGEILSYGHYLKEKEKEYLEKAPLIAGNLDFDLIHSQDRMPIDAAIKIKEITKKPMIATIHSTEFDKRKKIKKSSYNKEKSGMENAKKIIAISEYTKRIIMDKYGINARKIVVIGNGVEKGRIVRKKFGKIKYVLSLGRLTYQKGLMYLLEAAKIVIDADKNVRFLIVGSSETGYDKKLKMKAKSLGIEKYVKFPGFVPNKAAYYKKAHVFVMPSYSEPFGITPLEALSYGTPSIISKQSGVAKSYKNCIKVDYWDTKDLAKNILAILNDRTIYNRLIKSAICELKNFKWKSVAKKTISLYKKCDSSLDY